MYSVTEITTNLLCVFEVGIWLWGWGTCVSLTTMCHVDRLLVGDFTNFSTVGLC